MLQPFLSPSNVFSRMSLKHTKQLAIPTSKRTASQQMALRASRHCSLQLGPCHHGTARRWVWGEMGLRPDMEGT